MSNEVYVAIGKKWLFGLLGLHYAHSKRAILSDVRKQINELGEVAALELWGLSNSRRHMGWLLGKNHVLAEDAQGLIDSELIKAF